MRHDTFGPFALLVIAALGCHRQPDLESLRGEILDLHRSVIQAHLDKDAAFLARPTSPDYLSVANGSVRPMDADELERMLSVYLDSTEFTEYRDVAEPLVGFSRDGSLAWAIVQVRVAGSRSLPDGSSRAFDTRWAWITVYQRHGDQWLRLVDVSTNRPFNGSPSPGA
jgi:hypothetical protein